MSSPWHPFTPVGALEGGPSLRLLRPKKGQQKFSRKRCSQKPQKCQRKCLSVIPKKDNKNSRAAPVFRLKSKISTSNLAQKKFAPQPKSPSDAYDHALTKRKEKRMTAVEGQKRSKHLNMMRVEHYITLFQTPFSRALVELNTRPTGKNHSFLEK